MPFWVETQVLSLKIGSRLIGGLNRLMSQPLCGTKLKAQKSGLSQSINDIEIVSKGKEFHLVEDNDFGLTDDIHRRQIIKMQEAIIFVQKIRVMQWVLIDVVDLVEQ